jgi:hypothetical protein
MFKRTEPVRGSRVGDDVAWCPFNCAGGFLRIRFGEGDRVKLEDELRLLRRCAVGDELHRCGVVDELTLLPSCLTGDE